TLKNRNAAASGATAASAAILQTKTAIVGLSPIALTTSGAPPSPVSNHCHPARPFPKQPHEQQPHGNAGQQQPHAHSSEKAENYTCGNASGYRGCDETHRDRITNVHAALVARRNHRVS